MARLCLEVRSVNFDVKNDESSTQQEMVVRGPISTASGNRMEEEIRFFRKTMEEPRQISEEQPPATNTQITQIRSTGTWAVNYMQKCEFPSQVGTPMHTNKHKQTPTQTPT